MAPKINRMVLSGGVTFVLLPLLAVGLTKLYGESPEETERKMERMALDDHVKGSKGGDKDVHVMHEFIRKQAINQQADYSEILHSGRGKVKRQKDLERP